MGKIKIRAAAAPAVIFLSVSVLHAGLFNKKKDGVKIDPFAGVHAA